MTLESVADEPLVDALGLEDGFIEVGEVQAEVHGLVARTATSIAFGHQRFWVVYSPTKDQNVSTRLRNSRKILSHLHADGPLPGITRPIHWLEKPSMMLAEYYPDKPVRPLMQEITSTPTAFLAFAVQTTAILSRIHARKVRHGGLRPEAIRIRQNGSVWLRDFFNASFLFEGQKPTPFQEEYLRYLSPESTGRINRRVDGRADLYSLGATFFHILTGRALWDGTELEVANKLVTESPPVIGFHPAIDSVIMKLLAKMPEERYQQCEGLLADLEYIQQHLDDTSGFEAGQMDRASRFMLPQKLYGRKREMERLLEVYSRVFEKGRSRMVVVKGYAGVGKSTIIQHAALQMQAIGSRFCYGKFDQVNRKSFSGIIEALSDLIRQVLAESSEELEKWREDIKSTIGANAAALGDVIDDLRCMLRPEDFEGLTSSGNQEERLRTAFVDFLRVFARRKTLVIFLDDLQWASTRDLQLIASLAREFTTLQNILLLCAVRDSVMGEVDIVERVFMENVVAEELHLSPLEDGAVEELVCDTFRGAKGYEELGEVIMERTRGNPLYITAMLKRLHDKRRVHFNFNQKRWLWDIDAIKEEEVEKDVVDFILVGLKTLDPTTRDVMKMAACLGKTFTLRQLIIIVDHEVSSKLWPAQKAGLITSNIVGMTNVMPLTTFNEEDFLNVRATDVPSNSVTVFNGTSRVEYSFIHDRVQQACYALIPENEQASTHLTIGRKLYRMKDIFSYSPSEICNHVNRGLELLAIKERPGFALLNLFAAEKELQNTAYAEARNFARAARSLSSGSELITGFRLRTFQTLASSLYKLEMYEEALDAVDEFLLSASDLEKAKIMIVQLKVLKSLGRYNNAYFLGFSLLRKARVFVPNDPTDATQIRACLDLYQERLGAGPSELKALLPTLEKELIVAIQYVFVEMMPVVLHTAPIAFPLVTQISVSFSITGEKGGPAGAYMLVLHGFNLCNPNFPATNLDRGKEVDRVQGRRFGKILGLDMMEKDQHRSLACETYVVYGYLLGTVAPLQESVEHFRKAVVHGLESYTGDYVGFAIGNIGAWQFFAGVPIHAILNEVIPQLSTVERFRREDNLLWVKPLIQFLLNLQLQEAQLHHERYLLRGEVFNEGENSKSIEAEILGMPIHAYWLWKLILANIFGAPGDQLLHLAEKAYQFFDNTSGLPHSAYCLYHVSLAWIIVDPINRASVIRDCVRRLKPWVEAAPQNYAGLALHLEAELEDNYLRKLKLFDQAIAHAEENEHLHQVAFVSERCARLIKEHFTINLARGYISNAIRTYRQWGCARGDLLAEEFGEDPGTKVRHSEVGDANLSSWRNTPQEERSNPLEERLDQETAAKAALEISEERDVNEMVRKILRHLSQTTGAEYGALVSNRDDRLVVEATCERDQTNIYLQDEGADRVPWTVVNYVANARTEVVNDPDFLHTCTADPFLVREKPKSIFSFALVSQGRLEGVIYLHKRYASNAFERSKLMFLQLLSGLATESLVKARILQGMEAEIEARTKESKARELEAREARKEAEKATALKSSFLASMSHEIRTPFNAVLVALGLLQDGQLSTPQNDLVKVIKAASTDLLTIIDDILDLSKIESNKMTLTKEPFQLREAVEIALDVVGGVFTNKGLEYGYLSEVEGIVVGDIIRVRQVLVNLLGNAGKFTDAGHIVVRSTIKQYNGTDAIITISVEDTGIGIDQEHLGRLFASFTQVDSSSTRKYGGTGLGLAISKRLARMMGGDIEVKTKPNAGSTFYFSFRAATQPAEEDAPKMSGLCLVAMESDLIRAVFVQHLESMGFQCHSAKVFTELSTSRNYTLAVVDSAFVSASAIKSRFRCIVEKEHQIPEIANPSTVVVSPGIRRERLQDLTRSLVFGRAKSPNKTNLIVRIADEYPLKILLAEDNPVNVKVESMLFQKLGYHVDVVSNGLDAVEACKQKTYDLCFMDVHMPVMDGLVATRQICKIIPNPTKRPYICAMTANAMAGDMKKCLESGCDAYLSKPIQIANLTDVLFRCYKIRSSAQNGKTEECSC